MLCPAERLAVTRPSGTQRDLYKEGVVPPAQRFGSNGKQLSYKRGESRPQRLRDRYQKKEEGKKRENPESSGMNSGLKTESEGKTWGGMVPSQISGKGVH